MSSGFSKLLVCVSVCLANVQVLYHKGLSTKLDEKISTTIFDTKLQHLLKYLYRSVKTLSESKSNAFQSFKVKVQV